MTIDVYLAPASGPCRAVLMTAKFIGVDVNQKLVNLMAGEQLKPEFLKMNPQHCVPTIDDNGFYLWESRAIQTYLVNKYAPDSNLYPKDPEARAVVDRLLYFDIGTLYKAEAEYLYPQLFQGKPADPEKDEVFKKALGFLEQFLSKNDYVAGNNITLADLSVVASLSFAAEYPQLFQGKPADPEKDEVFKKALGSPTTTMWWWGEATDTDKPTALLADYSFDEFPKVNAWYQKVKSEIPGYKEINDEPLQQFKQILKSKK